MALLKILYHNVKNLCHVNGIKAPGGHLYFFLHGDVPLNRVSFSGFRLRDRVSFCKNRLHDRAYMGFIWSFLTPKGRCRPFALDEYDLNC